MQAIYDGDQLLTRFQTAEYLGLSTTTLAVWACKGDFRLPMVKFGRNVRYRLSDIQSYIQRHVVGVVKTLDE